MSDRVLEYPCCIAGGGPAGIMLGLLLARAGVRVIVLEKHRDFLRDFRGDTIHPSTLEVMHELGLLDQLLERPHVKLRQLQVIVGATSITVGDFSGLPTRCKYIAFMPQWDFLDFLAQQAARYPGFALEMSAEATDLLWEGDRVGGVVAETPEGRLEIRSDLLIAADGRGSVLRKEAGLAGEELGAPMDVLWMRLSKSESDPSQTLGRVESGRILIMIDRADYWQCAFVIPKGSWDRIKGRPLSELRDEIATVGPFLRDRLHELKSWDDVKLLTVRVDRLLRWYKEGLLCIGDAAHAMSPIGGVGINLAIQDAVAAANLLAVPLRRGVVEEGHLAAVQRRRELPTRITQRVQVAAQNQVIHRILGRDSQEPLEPPLPLRLAGSIRGVPQLVGRAVGLGVRPEHVRSPAVEPVA